MSVPPMLTKNLTYFKSVLCLSQKRDQEEPSNEVYWYFVDMLLSHEMPVWSGLILNK